MPRRLAHPGASRAPQGAREEPADLRARGVGGRQEGRDRSRTPRQLPMVDRGRALDVAKGHAALRGGGGSGSRGAARRGRRRAGGGRQGGGRGRRVGRGRRFVVRRLRGR
ncbi:hypothetical protein M885DRAFT_543857 [Pelagophyceae sp. CCMP2097]|nr:hypothetical protein M885DRAFT_543857 [Pelagophyceae sp. CCMP2097]